MLDNMAWPSQYIREQSRLIVWVEDAWFRAGLDGAHARRVRQPEDSPVGILAGAADNRNALGQLNLVPDVGVQVSTAHEARLRGVRVDPAEDHEVLGLGVDVAVEVLLIDHLARVGRRRLLGDDELGDEEGVAHQRAAQDAARLEPRGRIGLGDARKVVPQRLRQEDCPQRLPVLEPRGRGELVRWRGRWRRRGEHWSLVWKRRSGGVMRGRVGGVLCILPLFGWSLGR